MLDRINVQAFVFTNNPIFKLLILKRIPEKSGYWQPVCGGIENEEKPEEAVVREVFEETGITKIKNIRALNYEFIYREIKNGKLMTMKDICYAVEIDEALAIKLSNEHEKYKWCEYMEAKEYLKWEHNQIALEKLMSGR